MSVRPCALACVGERASGQAGKRTGTFILYMFSFFHVVLIYTHISFVFLYVRNYLICLQRLRVSFVLSFFSFFVLCLLNLVFMFGSSSRGDKFIHATNFACLFMMYFTNAHFLCVLSVSICVCVCVWCRTVKPAQY